MLATARRHYRRQVRIGAMGLREARRRAGRGSRQVASALGAYQLASALLAHEMAPEVLAEQGITATAVAEPVPQSVLSGTVAAQLFDGLDSAAAFDRLVLSLIQDAGRTAAVVDNATRPAVTGYVRSLQPPSCGRCAVLAGQVYRYSQGFLRHPQCDCLMTPTDQATGLELVTDADEMARQGQIRGLSKGDQEALDLGADLAQVVNIRRHAAGLTVGSSVLDRAGRPTPQGIMLAARDRDDQLALLRRHGYVL